MRTASRGHPTARAWEHVPLRTKVALLIIVAAVGGTVVGVVESHLGHAIWPMWLGLIGLVGGLVWLGRQWIWLPYERLLRQIEKIDDQSRPARLRSLPMDRKDEVGRFARVVDRISTRSLRDYHEAKQLRRSLDHGVEQATRQATHQLRQMAMRDPLTNLGNRRFLEENLEPLLQSAWVSCTELVCIAIDMDNFKQVNDTLGHAAGDELLLFLSKLILGSKRQEDYGVRLGGDEFVVLMPGCSMSRAQEFCDRLVSLFRQQVRTVFPGDVQADLSIGIASLTEGIATGRELLEAADANLYTAKRSGKGCVIAA